MRTTTKRPLAHQLRDAIVQLIRSQALESGEQLPSEEELVQILNASRSMVRESLRMLEEERVIYCEHGRGRFVSPTLDSLQEDITALHSKSEAIARMGLLLDVRVLAVSEEPAGEKVSAHLQCGPDKRVVRVERVWVAGSDALVYSVDVFSRELCPGEIAAQRFSRSLLAELEAQSGLRFTYSKALISAVTLAPELSNRIGAPLGSAWTYLEQVTYDKRDTPQLYSQDYRRGDRFSFHVLRHRR